jgi:anti-anti-sigma factor
LVDFVEKDSTLCCVFLAENMSTDKSMAAEKPVMEKLEGLKGGKVMFDMTKITYISSSFLRICARANSKAGKGNFCVVNLTPPVKKVFKIAGMAEIIADK